MAMLDCGKDKATELFRELEGIGLIERKKQGQGHPGVGQLWSCDIAADALDQQIACNAAALHSPAVLAAARVFHMNPLPSKQYPKMEQPPLLGWNALLPLEARQARLFQE